MFNYKVIVASSIIGFLLSFITGLFSGVGFGFVLLRAIIFAIALGSLAAVIMFVFDKFLDMDSVETNSYTTETNVGNMVDINIGEDELVEEDSAPGFYVDAKLTPNGSASSSNANSGSTATQNVSSDVVANDSASSKPIENVSVKNENVASKNVAENVQSSGTTNGFVRTDVQSMTSSANYSNYNENNSDDELDELPEFSSGNNSSSSGSSLYKDSPLMDKGVQDAELMAQAIRTILNKDG